jgi:tRNA (adenine22-N1)-methyltransferase
MLQQSKKIHIGKRLETVAETAAVRLSCESENTALCAIDVGCDHAKLPIYLVTEKGFAHVTATDINQGPVDSANRNVSLAGASVSQKIDVIKTDGLTGLEGVFCNRIIIAGMGGELIKEILSRAGFVHKTDEKIGFVFQPQSKQHILREYLCTGYRITDEKWIKDAGKTYCVISAVFDGKKRDLSLIELHFGTPGLKMCDEIFAEYFNLKYKILAHNIGQRKDKNGDGTNKLFAEEKELFRQMTEYIHEKRGSNADSL